ncbi:MAG: hypothetical protein IJ137_11055 [Eubacterium sp.]|nr:hypothetical protein [Eubacterium sp.]
MRSKEDTQDFIQEIEEKLQKIRQGRKPFSSFLLEKMDLYDYSNTSLARKVYHRVERKDDGAVVYVPVTRQAIGSWLKGSMPSSREIYVTLGLAFQMDLEEINYILLETYMGYGLYCKNIDDALWIAVINGLFTIDQLEDVRAKVEDILTEKEEADSGRGLATMDLWVMLSQAASLDEFYGLIRSYRDEFRNGARQFGQCMMEVIEEEYGYYEKASWFLRDIGLLHCEAQFSKIRAGKAIVTREWLLRFCIALQPTITSIEKLLAKAQMEPLGVSPSETILEMIARYRSDSLANSQEIWCMIESVAEDLRRKGYEIEDDLCRKYDTAWEIPFQQKWLFSVCAGREILDCQRRRDYGYEKLGYCRYTLTDRILFEDINRIKKITGFKKEAQALWDGTEDRPVSVMDYPVPELLTWSIPKGYQADVLDLEKFTDYCYMRRPSRLSKDFQMNDIYFFSALLYSLWTGKCWTKDFDSENRKELEKAFEKAEVNADAFIAMMEANLHENASWKEENDIAHMISALWKLAPESV